MQLLRGLEQLLPQLQGQRPILPSGHTQVKAASKGLWGPSFLNDVGKGRLGKMERQDALLRKPA